MESAVRFLNMAGESFVGYSNSMLVQSSVLILVLLVLNLFLQKKVRVAFLYGIWMLLLVKLVLPTTLSSPVGIGYWLGNKVPSALMEKAAYISNQLASLLQSSKPAHDTVLYDFLTTGVSRVASSPDRIADISANPAMMASPATAKFAWQGLVLLGWLAVVIAMLALLLRRMVVVKRLLTQSKSPNNATIDIFERCRRQMGIKQLIFLELSPLANSPSVCGIFRPRILIPQDLIDKLNADDLRSVFLHELAHVKRGDVWVSLMQTILQIAYFYNPLLWMANAIIRKVREQAVDEMVLVAMGEKAEDYPETLLNVSRMTFGRPALNLRLIGIIESKKALERRIMIMLSRPVPKKSRLGICGLMAIFVVGSVILPMGYHPAGQSAAAASQAAGKTIVPGIRVGEYTFNMSKDDVLERLGKPRVIFYGDNRYSLDNPPEKYYMPYRDISFLIVNGSVREITALSPAYKFTNGIRVGDSEQKVKKAFGGDFHIREFTSKDYLTYEDKGLMFEINREDRTVMEINVSPSPDQKSHMTAGDIVSMKIVPGIRVGNYTFNMTKDDILDSLGKPRVIFYGDKRYSLDDPPEKYYMPYEDISFLIVKGSVKGITALSPSYKLTNGIRVGDSEQKVKKAFGKDFRIREFERKDFLSFPDEGLMFEIDKQDRTIMEINVSPVPGSEGYKKADIPPTSYINEQGRIVDKIDWPFVNDPQVIGTWESVDFVREIEDFEPDEKNWDHGELYLKGFIFKPDGKTFKPWWTWTKGLVFHAGDKTASKYTIKHIEGSAYMFYEWKSGDYTMRYMKPFYYILKKVSSRTTGPLDKKWISEQEEDEEKEDPEFTRKLAARIKRLDIDTADLAEVKEIFGKPHKYVWGQKILSEDSLPKRYVLVYPGNFHIYMRDNQIVELRHEHDFSYVYRNKLRCGSSLDEVFEVVGYPEKTVQGEENRFQDGVLYRDIEGREGYCYYARHDHDVRLWFLDNRLGAIYMTRSDYGE